MSAVDNEILTSNFDQVMDHLEKLTMQVYDLSGVNDRESYMFVREKLQFVMAPFVGVPGFEEEYSRAEKLMERLDNVVEFEVWTED